MQSCRRHHSLPAPAKNLHQQKHYTGEAAMCNGSITRKVTKLKFTRARPHAGSPPVDCLLFSIRFAIHFHHVRCRAALATAFLQIPAKFRSLEPPARQAC
uniref:(northern house mosquito) hypothetical protein n=1 Tax=Culex pipiens TaxID=7175 RepID=A0A8D8F190_CULPI